MNNKEIAQHFSLLADLMELHGENPFKIKSYAFAARHLKNIDKPLSSLSVEELEAIDGVGKAIASKVYHLCKTGKLDLLQNYVEITPSGVIELLQLKGIGPKKIAQLWKELEIESIGELEYACKENRLVELKGFGKKTQDNILMQLQFIQQHLNKFLWASLEQMANEISEELQQAYPNELISTCGDFRRREIIIEQIDFLVGTNDTVIKEAIEAKYKGNPVVFHFCTPDVFYTQLLQLSSHQEHYAFLSFKIDMDKKYASEDQLYKEAGYAFVPPELRDNRLEWKMLESNTFASLLQLSDIKGVVHAHSNYSDGATSLKELAVYCRDQGYEYLVISDHSKSAFYANGLSVQRVLEQQEEIDLLNKQLAPFKIFKSIECDILNDGSLDYDDAILKTFDLVIASVHAQLKMNEEKAMNRLLKAIENPYTTILGHLTGRLLLSRPGYPVNHQKIIDACAANKVSIELNANPRRLDLDYTWLDYCQQKGVLVSVNPDAHSLTGVQDIRYGVSAARKGGLLKENTLNALTKYNFEQFIKIRSSQ